MELFFRKKGSGIPLVILHGLYGSSDNWMSIAKHLSEKFEVFLPDLRNHGRSFHSVYHNYELLQNDIYLFFKQQKIKKAVIIGHSMGGKAAMFFANRHPELTAGLVIVDISPRQYKTSDSESSHYNMHKTIIKTLMNMKLDSLSGRKEAADIMSKHIEQAYLRNFLLKNLYRDKDNVFRWRINLPVLYKSLPDIMAGFNPEDIVAGFPVLFVKGGVSDYILPDDFTLINKIFPSSDIVEIKNASHWLHAEYPDKFLSVIYDFVFNS